MLTDEQFEAQRAWQYGFTVAHIARALGRPYSTVWYWIHRTTRGGT